MRDTVIANKNNEISADIMNLIATYGMITPEVVEAARRKQMADLLSKYKVQIPEPSYREAKGDYLVKTPARYSIDKKRYTVTGRTPEECKERFREKIVELLIIMEQGERAEDKAKKMTVSATVEEFIRSRKDGLKTATYERYMRCWHNHIRGTEFGNRLLREIRQPDCQQYIGELYHKKLCYGSMKQMKSVISQTFDYAIAKGYVPSNQMKTAKININLCSQERKHETTAWSDEEIRKLSEGAKIAWKSHKFYYSAVYMALIFTGCRVGELLAANWDDIDFERKTFSITKTVIRYTEYDTGKKILTVDKTKTADGQRVIALTDEAIYWLKEINRRNEELGRNSGLVVETREGGYVKGNAIDDSAKRFCKFAGVDYHSSHTCRRTYATILIDNGVPLTEISADLGHKSISTTQNCYYKKRQGTEDILSQKNAIFKETLGNR